MQGMTIAEARRALSNAFRQSGIDSPELDARILIGYALGLDHTALAAAANRALDENAAHTLAILAERRMAREPIARIVGGKEFWGLQLRITQA